MRIGLMLVLFLFVAGCQNLVGGEDEVKKEAQQQQEDTPENTTTWGDTESSARSVSISRSGITLWRFQSDPGNVFEIREYLGTPETRFSIHSSGNTVIEGTLNVKGGVTIGSLNGLLKATSGKVTEMPVGITNTISFPDANGVIHTVIIADGIITSWTAQANNQP